MTEAERYEGAEAAARAVAEVRGPIPDTTTTRFACDDEGNLRLVVGPGAGGVSFPVADGDGERLLRELHSWDFRRRVLRGEALVAVPRMPGPARGQKIDPPERDDDAPT